MKYTGSGQQVIGVNAKGETRKFICGPRGGDGVLVIRRFDDDGRLLSEEVELCDGWTIQGEEKPKKSAKKVPKREGA